MPSRDNSLLQPVANRDAHDVESQLIRLAKLIFSISSNMFRFLGGAAVPMMVAIIFALCRRYVPGSADAPRHAPPVTELASRFQFTQWIVAGGILASGTLIFVSLHSVLVMSNEYFASFDGPAEFVLLPQTAIWFFLPSFAALTLSWDVMLWAWSFFGSRQTAPLYEYWSNTKAGFNATRVLRIMALVIALPIAILTALALPEHASLREDGIRDKGYGFARVQVFNYSDAKTLEVIQGFRNRDGSMVKRAGCVLHFSDGRKWSSAAIGNFRLVVDSALVSFLERKTGLHAKYAAMAADLD